MVVVGMLAIRASYACRLFRLYIVCTVSCGFPPIIHVRWCHALAVTAADAIQAFAELAGEQPIIVGFAESVGERDEPLEPVQVGVQVFRGYAVEAEHESLQSRVQRVHAVDGVVALLWRQFAKFLPDPIGYTRHLARSHTYHHCSYPVTTLQGKKSTLV